LTIPFFWTIHKVRMIQMLFSLHFQSQLRRIRPELIDSLENAIRRAAEISGATVQAERRCITASFDEHSIGFALDILLVIKAVQGAIQRALPELYGYACVFGRDIAENGQALLNRLPRNSGGAWGEDSRGASGTNSHASGIWCSQALRNSLAPYAVFDPSPFNGDLADYGQLRELTPLARPLYDGDPPLQNCPQGEAIRAALEERGARNALLVGPDLAGSREVLCGSFGNNRDFPALVFRFGCGGTGLSCFSDALEAPIQDLIPPEKRDALKTLGAFLFKERLEDEFTPFAVKKTGQFLSGLLESYLAAAVDRRLPGTILVENLHLANPVAARVFVDVYDGLAPALFPAEFRLLGTSREDPKEDGAAPSLGMWAALFPPALRFPPAPELPENDRVPRDVAELAYAAALFKRYFPASLMFQLFEEEGKNLGMIKTALGMLSSLGCGGMAEDPQAGERALGEGKYPIQRLARNRLLAWVKAFRIRPGFKLLQALRDLGETASEELVLEALQTDLLYGIFGTLRQAGPEFRLDSLTGPACLPALRFIWRTTESLLWGDEAAIAAAFEEPWSLQETLAGDAIPSYKTRILANTTAYKLGIRDVDGASALAREAMHISQNQNGGRGLAQSYRLFSLVNLSKGRISDAIEYSFFAVEQAEKSDDFAELAVSAYYAAAMQFLFGNISRAERLILRAEETALSAGLAPWADRAQFFRGKLLFETGHYREALDLFTALLRSPAGVLNAEAEDTLEAWIYRSAVFLEIADAPKPRRPNIDARYFEIEAAYLTEDYRKAVELADALLPVLPEREYLFIEQPDWRSGFSQGELLFFSSREFRAPLISSYRAMALCCLDEAGRAEARSSIEEIIKDERYFEMDPNGAFYFFAHYRVLGKTDAPLVDMDTAVSMAFKRLQRRASRIDDIEVNRAFLTRHYWNAALSRAAKEHKLI
jgi:tetratricopeptide (TPR) repeat protein